jgi:hypothetical protein
MVEKVCLLLAFHIIYRKYKIYNLYNVSSLIFILNNQYEIVIFSKKLIG